MSTITKEFTKEQLIEKLQHRIAVAAKYPDLEEAQLDAVIFKIALASLEAEPAIHRWRRVTSEPYGPYPWHYGDFIGFSKPVDGIEDEYFYFAPPAPAPAPAPAKAKAEPVAWLWSHRKHTSEVTLVRPEDDEMAEVSGWSGWSCQALYAAPPAPVSVPAAMEMDDNFDSAFEHGKAVGWNSYRAAMLQGADGTLTNEGTIPVTQFKPVADLYGLTSPTGCETSFTFDAVEARDFIDGGWSCQEYVELERFQEAITNHTEDKLAMVDHSGDSNNMVEPVTTAYKLRDAVEIIRNSGIEIDSGKIQAERDSHNSPVIPDGWVACSEKMPEENSEQEVLACFKGGDISTLYYFEGRWDDAYGIVPIRQDVTHWMPLPAAPQQEVKP